MIDKDYIFLMNVFLNKNEGPKGESHVVFSKKMFKNQYHLQSFYELFYCGVRKYNPFFEVIEEWSTKPFNYRTKALQKRK